MKREARIIHYIAHKREEDGEKQALKEHLMQVAVMAKEFAQVFGCGSHAYICGLLHDLGKYSKEFLKRIEEDGPKCDHATAGAQKLRVVNQDNQVMSDWFAYIILGHHGGMPDFGSKTDYAGEGTFNGRMLKEVPDYSAYKQDFKDEQFKFKEMPPLQNDTDWGFKISFLVRMVYSCVVDADYLDTEKFMTDGKIQREKVVDFLKMKENLDQVIVGFKQNSVVNKYRKEILDGCLKAALRAPGMFQLTVPTGGGKTIASAAFALNHLLHNKEQIRRIIYVIPYCSIIEQNAKVFADIFGTEVVLEHHSNYDFDSKEDDFNDKKKLASENWDMPFIVTTNVQFFESLYSNKPSRCRKLHNIAGSVIIFDEIQAIPTNYLAPCMRAIEELVREYHCSAVLCSATQPKLEPFFRYKIPTFEMCKEPDAVFEALKRTHLNKAGEMSIDALADKICCSNQALAVLNKRDTTKYLYEKVKERGSENIFHLSTYMCPQHRKEVIAKIRSLLKSGLPCKVMSTNLIEAGVDLDFQEVYRELAGIDSIVQAAGRANREGKREKIGEVYVFSFEEKEFRVSTDTPFGQYLDKCGQNAQKIMDTYADIFSPQAINEYFTRLYCDMEKMEFDGAGILTEVKGFYHGGTDFRFYYKELAELFHLIDEDTYPVLVPYNDEAKSEIERLSSRYFVLTRKDMRANQKYMVNLRKGQYYKMLEQNRIVKIAEGLAFLRNEDEYSSDTGLEMEVEFGIGMFM